MNNNDTRPGYFNNVHGIAIDPKTRRVFVNDRGNHRVQVFDENGKFMDQWSFGPNPSDVHLFHIFTDGYLWAADRGTSKMLNDLNGNSILVGHVGRVPRRQGVHGFAVDTDGNRTPQRSTPAVRRSSAHARVRRARSWASRCAWPGSSSSEHTFVHPSLFS